MTIHCFENQLRYTVGYTLNEYYIIIKYTHLPIRYRVTISKIPALTKVFHSSNISHTYRLIWCPIYSFSLSLSLSLSLSHTHSLPPRFIFSFFCTLYSPSISSSSVTLYISSFNNK